VLPPHAREMRMPQSTCRRIFGIVLERVSTVREPVRAVGQRRSAYHDLCCGSQANRHIARGSAIRHIFLPAPDEFFLLRLALPTSSSTHLISGGKTRFICE
jgi:hypothetical protein